MQDPLPLNSFEWMSSYELEDIDYILKCSKDSEIGYILQVTLEYPSSLHKTHSDYPLAPHKLKIPFNKLSCFAKTICFDNNLKRSTGTEKLMCTFLEKKDYVLHYRNLQLYVLLGMKIKKVISGIKFKQSPFIKKYIDFNTKMRSESKNDFDSNFYKLLSNSLFGKTIERPDKRTHIKLVNTISSYEKYVSKLNFKSAKIINKDLVGIEMKYISKKLNKPFIIGMSILDIAKWYMYNFHYNIIKPYFKENIQVLYTDTDSFIYEISNKTYDEIVSIFKQIDIFDFSNYPSNHILFNSKNKKVPGYFKDEMGSKQIEEFVGLRSKMYAIKFCKHEEIKAAKGVKKNIIKQNFTFNLYKDILFSSGQREDDYKNIASHSHNVQTLHQKKITLSSFDDKRYLLNEIYSVPYS